MIMFPGLMKNLLYLKLEQVARFRVFESGSTRTPAFQSQELIHPGQCHPELPRQGEYNPSLPRALTVLLGPTLIPVSSHLEVTRRA